jgi:hypothetical protein
MADRPLKNTGIKQVQGYLRTTGWPRGRYPSTTERFGKVGIEDIRRRHKNSGNSWHSPAL